MTSYQANPPVSVENYTQGTGTSSSDPFITVFSNRDPTANDFNYPIKKRWINTVNITEWVLTSFSNVTGQTLANWLQLANQTSDFKIINVQVFASPGSTPYTPTPGMLYCTIEVQGAGGGGGGAGLTGPTEQSSGGGGGGGGYARITVAASTIGAFQTVIVGAGGTGGAATPTGGTAGGTSSVGSIVSATGGAGGNANGATTTTGIGGAASSPGTGIGGDLNLVGGVGEAGLVWFTTTGNFGLGGHGGQAPMGGPNQYVSGSSGISGNTFGVGGSGGQCGVSTGAGAGGGPGVGGYVIITEFIS